MSFHGSLHRQFKSPKVTLFDDDSKEFVQKDHFKFAAKIRGALQGYTAKVYDEEDRVYRCVKAASKRHIRERITLENRPTQEDFFGERDLLKRLSAGDDCHPSICKYVADWEIDNIAYFAMELARCECLYDFTEKKLHGTRQISNQTRLKVTSRIMNRIVDVMSWLQGKAILHMDASLENFVLNNRNPLWPEIKIIDLGAALDYSGEEKRGLFGRVEWIHDQWVGKPFYMVPEVARNRRDIVEERGFRIPYDAKAADIGTLGSILFIMLLGWNPPKDLQKKAHLRGMDEWIFQYRVQSRFNWDALDLLNRLWTPEEKRITMNELVQHPFIVRGCPSNGYSQKKKHSRKQPDSSSSSTMTHESMDIDPSRSSHPEPGKSSRFKPEISSHQVSDTDDRKETPNGSISLGATKTADRGDENENASSSPRHIVLPCQGTDVCA